MFGLLSLSAAAGSSINKQRRMEVWDPRVCLVPQRLRGLDRRLSRIIVSPQSRGSACAAEAQIQSGVFVYERRVWTGVKLGAAG